MPRIRTKINKGSLTTKLTLIIGGLTAGSALLVPATYASFHPVTTGEIADGTIRSADISNTAGVQSVDIVNGQVGSVDIGQGQVANGDIANNAIRAPMSRISGEPLVLGPSSIGRADAICPGGSLVTGGGYHTNGGMIIDSSQATTANSWSVFALNTRNTENSVTAFAMCIAPMP